jgi:hypothetical protein
MLPRPFWALLFLFCVTLVRADPIQFPPLAVVLKAVSEAGYSETPYQIPATVIDTGTLRFVPYVSYRIGENRELNIYGDLMSPACVEIGLFKERRTSLEEQYKCVALMRKLFPQMDVASVKLSGGKAMKIGGIVEVTPPDAPDAEEGWWVSVYSLELLHQARGTSDTVSIVSSPVSASGNSQWSQADLARARRRSGTRSWVGRVYDRAYSMLNGTYTKEQPRSK